MGRPKKEVDYSQQKITLFDHLKNITSTKGDYLGDEGWSNFMVNKFLSMEENYCELVNYIQKNTWRISGFHLYNFYKNIIPKQYVFLKYIKNQNKSEDIDQKYILAISKYFEISNKEAKEYIQMMSKEEVENITNQINGK